MAEGTQSEAGTRRRGDTPAEDAAFEAELRDSPKEVAEHTMLVDLVRHDLGRVAAPGSVTVPDLMLVERYSHVMHLVSEVQARARTGVTLRDVLAATFPGGTITGAPKERVMEVTRDLEPGPRGWYTGGLGLVSGPLVDVNILIRTAAFTRTDSGWTVEVRAGGGTVIDADPTREAQETVHKAQALLSVLAGVPGRPAQPPQPRAGRPGPRRPPRPTRARGCCCWTTATRSRGTSRTTCSRWARGWTCAASTRASTICSARTPTPCSSAPVPARPTPAASRWP